MSAFSSNGKVLSIRTFLKEGMLNLKFESPFDGAEMCFNYVDSEYLVKNCNNKSVVYKLVPVGVVTDNVGVIDTDTAI